MAPSKGIFYLKNNKMVELISSLDVISYLEKDIRSDV